MNAARMRSAVGVLLVCGGALAFLAAEKMTPKGQINFEKDRIVIPHAVQLGDDDLKNLTRTLEQHKKQLYQVVVFQKGAVSKDMGALMCQPKLVVDRIKAEAKSKGYSHVAIQISSKVGAGQTPGPSGSPGATGQNCNIPHFLKTEAAELLRQVRPILEKYKAG